MTVILEKETSFLFALEYEEIANTVISAVLDYIQCPYECQVNILLTDNEGIRQTNLDMRGIDAPTDVLSFPMIEFETEGDFSVVEETPDIYFEGDSGELLLGDIMISLERVESQAKEYNHSIKREYAFLIAHSVLHLSGYDHIDEEERKRMEQLQDMILQEIGYTRDIQ
ncbi:MAG: rRNA maturation RNase YbeY [Eubacteriales bacterium]|nr:rRNA maturation RNase YbeY [Eubacteriales bacterium]